MLLVQSTWQNQNKIYVGRRKKWEQKNEILKLNHVTDLNNADDEDYDSEHYKYEERRKELAFEGERFHDMQRLQRVINRSANYPSSYRTVALSDFRRVFPIPQAELDANPTIRTQQNPGW